MSDAITVAVITSGASLIGIMVSQFFSNQKLLAGQQALQAVMEERIEHLSRQLDGYKEHVDKVPVIEKQLEIIEKDIDGINKDIESINKRIDKIGGVSRCE